MKIIQIVSRGRLIFAPLVLSSYQAAQLQQLRNPIQLRKLIIEIATNQNNLPNLVAIFRQNNISENDFIGFRVADSTLSTSALDPDFDDRELIASGDVVIVPFKVRRSHLSFDLEALGLYSDNRGRLQVQKIPGQGLKK